MITLLQQLGIDNTILDKSEYRLEVYVNDYKYVYTEYSPLPYWYIFKIDNGDQQGIIYSESSLKRL